jgi:hypothetical protein
MSHRSPNIYGVLLVVVLIALLLMASLVAVNAQSPSATPEPFPISVFRDKDSLTVLVPGTRRISLRGFTFQVTVNNEVKDFPLEAFSTFSGFVDNMQAPLCLRLQRFETQSPFPLKCPDSPPTAKITHVLNDVDVFWYDPNAQQYLLIKVTRGVDEYGQCPPSASECPINYVFPPTATPTETPNIQTLIVQGGTQTVDAQQTLTGIAVAQTAAAGITETQAFGLSATAYAAQTLTSIALAPTEPPTDTPDFPGTVKAAIEQTQAEQTRIFTPPEITESPTPTPTIEPPTPTFTPTFTPTDTPTATSTPTPTPPPDLVISASLSDRTPTRTRPVTVSITVRNQGAGPAGPFEVTWTSTRQSPVRFQWQGLAAGESHVFRTAKTYDQVGTANWVAIVDSTNLVIETNETNNTVNGSLTVQPRRANVVVRFTKIDIHNDAEPGGSGDLVLKLTVSGGSRSQSGNWPNSGTKQVDGGKSYTIDNESMTIPLEEDQNLSITVIGTDKDSGVFRAGDDKMGTVRAVHLANREWDKGRPQSKRSDCPDGCFTIHYTISVNWQN